MSHGSYYKIIRRYISRRRNKLSSRKREDVLKLALILVTVVFVSHTTVTVVKHQTTIILNAGDGFNFSAVTMKICARNTSLRMCRTKSLISEKFNVSKEIHSFEKLAILHGNDLSPGGHFRPVTCQPDQKVAIVIPYRDREDHLKMLLNNLHPFLKKQDIDYIIFVVEQLPGSKFNRGMMKNIGFVEALQMCRFDCFFFHDVDMVPNDNGNVYQCGPQPRHHAKDLERWKHKRPYAGSFGGVVSMTNDQFTKVNGYSNTYFEWGLEEDEMGTRVKYRKMKLTSYHQKVGSYVEFGHEKSKQYKKSWKWVKSWRSRIKSDGLNSLVYTVKEIDFKPLYVHIYVSINVTLVKIASKGNILIAEEEEKPAE